MPSGGGKTQSNTVTTQDFSGILNRKISGLEEKLLKITPKPYLKQFEIHITDHCNLNCKSCAHWSSISDEFYISLEDFTRDFTRMKELTNGHVDQILLLGGEPLLHPQITKLAEIARNLFPNTPQIGIFTNGILVNKMDDNFWQILKDNNITLETTQYPINIDYEAIKNKCKNLGIKYINAAVRTGKTWLKTPMDLTGKQDAITNFLNCWSANRCITLKEGKLYTCVRIPHISNFNKSFNQNLEVTDRDYIDIYKAKDIDEILAFLAKPAPFCRYCGIKGRTTDYWGVTKKDISEWT